MTDDMKDAVNLACFIDILGEQVEELKGLLYAQNRIINAQFGVLKTFADLYTELTDTTSERQFLRKEILKAERQANQERLDLWFWRPEEDITVARQVKRRAIFLLKRKRFSLDDTWDLLREFIDDYAREDVTDDQLQEIIRDARSAKLEEER